MTSKSINITEILASNNLISQISTDNLEGEIVTLDLRNNSLKDLSVEVIQTLMSIKNVWLGGNPWLCDCSHIEFFKAMKSLNLHVQDYKDLACENLGKKFKDLRPYEVCFNWPVAAICLSLLAVLGTTIGIFYKFKKHIKIFLYAHNMCLWFVTEEELDEDKLYDAYVCFASQDQSAVEDIIIRLENDGFSCLVGFRDWPPGHMFPELVSCFVKH